eukprot:scaffold41885_cov150-Skeletonema_dohrnii-CCMP3373.AAC.1
MIGFGGVNSFGQFCRFITEQKQDHRRFSLQLASHRMRKEIGRAWVAQPFKEQLYAIESFIAIIVEGGIPVLGPYWHSHVQEGFCNDVIELFLV